MRERGMSWDSLRALIRRNATPNSAIRYYYDPDINRDQIAVLDCQKPRRRPEVLELTGYTPEDWWRDSHIAEAAFFNGEIPMEGYVPKTDRDGKLVGKPYRGALALLTIMVHEGCLDWRSDELRELFSRHGRRLPSPPFS